jgi:hypothetical protein
MDLIIVAMTDSIHTARWLVQFSDQLEVSHVLSARETETEVLVTLDNWETFKKILCEFREL